MGAMINNKKERAVMVKGFYEFVNESREIGFREVITIPGIGDLVAKFDTGNGSRSCSLTYDRAELSEDGARVDWELNGRRFSNPITGFSEAEVGDRVHGRPVIELDVEFAGRLYPAVPVSLVDRSGKSTKFLANRGFMERVGCAVSPFKTFVVSSFDGDYSADLAKRDPHAGIVFRS